MASSALARVHRAYAGLRLHGYDNADRLTASTNLGDSTLSESFVYAANDNMLSRSRVAGTYTYPAATSPRPHAPTSVGANAMAYDANGNLTSDGSRTLSWDEANRLKTVTLASNTVNLTYGPDGARTKKSSSFATTLYPDASVEIDPATPGAEIYTRYPHPDIKVTGNYGDSALISIYDSRSRIQLPRTPWHASPASSFPVCPTT